MCALSVHMCTSFSVWAHACTYLSKHIWSYAYQSLCVCVCVCVCVPILSFFIYLSVNLFVCFYVCVCVCVCVGVRYHFAASHCLLSLPLSLWADSSASRQSSVMESWYLPTPPSLCAFHLLPRWLWLSAIPSQPISHLISAPLLSISGQIIR